MQFLEKEIKLRQWQDITRRRRRRREANITYKILPNSSYSQFHMVHIPRLHLPNPSKHIMGLLGLSPFSNGSSTRLGLLRPRVRFIFSWLVHRGFVLRQPSDHPVLRRRKHLRWLRGAHLRGDPYCLLGIERVQCQNVPNIFIGSVHFERAGVWYNFHCW